MHIKKIFCILFLFLSLPAHSEMSQADVDLNYKELGAFWLHERCKESNVDGKCWIPIDVRKDLYAKKENLYLGVQKLMPANAEVLRKDCGKFPYTTGFTTTNLPNKAVCVELVGANQARFFYPAGMIEHGTYSLFKSSKDEFNRRNKNSDIDAIKRNNR